MRRLIVGGIGALAIGLAPVAHAGPDYYCLQPELYDHGRMTYTFCYGDGWYSVTTCINGNCSTRYR